MLMTMARSINPTSSHSVRVSGYQHINLLSLITQQYLTYRRKFITQHKLLLVE